MTTVRNMEDLARVLRERPEWREELRKQILTEQLLALPKRFAEHAADVDRRAEAMEKLAEASIQRLDALEKLVAEACIMRLDTLERLVAENARLIQVNTDHIGHLKGMVMEIKGNDNAPLITSDMGLAWKKTLARHEVVALVDEAVRDGSARDIPRNHLRSLRQADLVIEAEDTSGNDCRVIVEISWTADERDVDRAIRGAGYLKLFTGEPAYAAVGSSLVDKNVEDFLIKDTPRPHGTARHEKAFHSVLD